MYYLDHPLRHEKKFYINMGVYHTLRKRFKEVLQIDKNMHDEEGYIISSLYFDDIYHSALEEKVSGICFRKKFRMRCYNHSDEVIKLECKRKYGEYISKTSARLTREEYEQILNGEYLFLANREEKVCNELLAYHNLHLLKPVVSVEYQREAYVLEQGNVRLTFDKKVSTSVGNYDMFADDYVTKNVLENDIMILEVKYDDFIPSVVLELLTTAMTNECAISKYVMCRSAKGRILYR